MQHLYAWALYSFTSLFWVFANNVIQAAKGDPRTGKRFPLRHWLGVFAGVALHSTLFLVIPYLYSGFAWWQVAVGFVAMHLVGGFTLAVVFQLAHIVEGPDYFPLPSSDGRFEDTWAAHQLRTTANFGVDSWLTRFITGGLNQQIEHHLFPRICHIHYKALAPIVRETAAKHGLPYYENDSFFTAVASHARLLKRNGALGLAEIEASGVAATLPAE
jgi:linoleoyl-CoA desaturase